jgi:hypothetical protein
MKATKSFSLLLTCLALGAAQLAMDAQKPAGAAPHWRDEHQRRRAARRA